MNEKNQEEANTGGDERGGEEVEDGPEGDHAAHLGIEAGRASDETGDHEGKYHQLEKSHEELARVGYQVDGGVSGLIVTESQAPTQPDHNSGKC